jgi:hypothetical protein
MSEHHAVIWEYQRAELHTQVIATEVMLRKAGDQGWELVAIYKDVAYFKRVREEKKP